MSSQKLIPDLEERFLEPPGWRSHKFFSHGMNITFGSAFPQDSIPDAVVVCLPGLSEFCEKYYEVARTCLDMNLAFWVLDWPGQGRSDRYLENPHMRHGDDFGIEVERLHNFILGYIKHSSVHPDKGRIPLVMLGHSMGANIGLRYLAKYPETFECAAFSAPLCGIQKLKRIPLSKFILKAFNKFSPTSYVYGGADWHETMRHNSEEVVFSNDDIRNAVHAAWLQADPSLAIGSPTYSWLYHAQQSCEFVKRSSFLKSITTPCLITIAGKETIVDNDSIRYIADKIEGAQLLELPEAGHEVLMERDVFRDQFFKEFYKLIEKTVIQRPETLKPF